jgi:hypothetical protein
VEAEDLCEDDSAAAIPAASPAPATPAATNGVAPAPVDAIADPFPEGFARALLLLPSFATLSQFINGNVFVRSRPWTSPDPATSYTKAMGANRGQLSPSREPLNFTAASLM